MSDRRLIFVGDMPRTAGVIFSRTVAAISSARSGNTARVDGSTLLIPYDPSDAVILTTTPLVTFFDFPPLEKTATNGIATTNVSTVSMRTDCILSSF